MSQTRKRPFGWPIVCGLVAASAWLASAAVPGCGGPEANTALDGDAGPDGAAGRRPPPAVLDGAPADAGPEAASFAALVDDASIWHPIPNPGTSNLHEANVVPDPFPKRVWSSCGPGCSVTPAALPFSPPVGVYAVTASADYVNGGVYLNASFANPIATVTRLERLPEGTTIAATVARRPSGAAGQLARAGGAAPFMFLILGGNDLFRYGRAPQQPGDPIVWQPDWRSDTNTGRVRFVFDDGLGVGTPSGPLLMDDDAGPLMELSGAAERIAGHGNQLVWTAGYAPAIFSYTKAKGQVELVPMQDRGAIRVALSDERLVWISGARVNDRYADRRWQWSPRVDDPANVVVHDGPAIDGMDPPLDEIKTGADWAAVTRCPVLGEFSTCKLVAWNMTTNQTVSITGRPGFYFFNILGVTPTELYLGEVLIRPGGLFNIDNIVRLEIGALPSLAAGAGWPQ